MRGGHNRAGPEMAHLAGAQAGAAAFGALFCGGARPTQSTAGGESDRGLRAEWTAPGSWWHWGLWPAVSH